MNKTATSLSAASIRGALAPLRRAHAAAAGRRPGGADARRPVHVVYGGAHLFKAATARKLGDSALAFLNDYAPDAVVFANALGLSQDFAPEIYSRVVGKLRREPVEDYRIDFEDGYGLRPDEEEDAHAAGAAAELLEGRRRRSLPPFIGIRIKPLTPPSWGRSTRTLDIVLTALGRGGGLPENFALTLPKIERPSEVAVLSRLIGRLESKTHLRRGSVKIELMIETPEAIASPRGLVEAAGGRCVGAHFGTYDYTASIGLTASEQRMHHPACGFAKRALQVALAGTGIAVCDGATTLMPVVMRRSGAEPSAEELRADRDSVHAAWKAHYDDARTSLSEGFYQGWDLHPAQLVSRYAAVYAFFLEGLAAASTRLRNFVEKAARATATGQAFDDAATGQGLLNFFLRGLGCGAISEAEVRDAGLSPEELATRSFLKILEGRS